MIIPINLLKFLWLVRVSLFKIVSTFLITGLIPSYINQYPKYSGSNLQSTLFETMILGQPLTAKSEIVLVALNTDQRFSCFLWANI